VGNSRSYVDCTHEVYENIVELSEDLTPGVVVLGLVQPDVEAVSSLKGSLETLEQ